MTTEEKIAVMQALVEGKEIEIYNPNTEAWLDIKDPNWNWEEYDYRIKPEPKKPKVRPYKDAEELMEAIKKHGSWVKDIEGVYYSISRVSFKNGELLIDGTVQDWYLENVTFADGTPFGVEEGGEE